MCVIDKNRTCLLKARTCLNTTSETIRGFAHPHVHRRGVQGGGRGARGGRGGGRPVRRGRGGQAPALEVRVGALRFGGTRRLAAAGISVNNACLRGPCVHLRALWCAHLVVLWCDHPRALCRASHVFIRARCGVFTLHSVVLVVGSALRCDHLAFRARLVCKSYCAALARTGRRAEAGEDSSHIPRAHCQKPLHDLPKMRLEVCV